MFSSKRELLCRNARDMLSEYIDNRLSNEKRSLVERHLGTCAACSQELESLRTTIQLLHRLPEIPVPHSFTVSVPEPRREKAFGPSSLRWLQPATAIVAIALVVLLIGDFLNVFGSGVNQGTGSISSAQAGPTPTPIELQIMVAVPGVMGQMALATARAVGYTDYTIVRSVPPSPDTEKQIMVAVPGVMGQMSLATAKAVGYTDYSILPSSAVSQPVTQPVPSVIGNEGPSGTGVIVQGEASVGWPLRQTEIGLGAVVFVLLALIIFARRQSRKKVTARDEVIR